MNFALARAIKISIRYDITCFQWDLYEELSTVNTFSLSSNHQCYDGTGSLDIIFNA